MFHECCNMYACLCSSWALEVLKPQVHGLIAICWTCRPSFLASSHCLSLSLPPVSLSHIPLPELHLFPSSSFSPLFYLWLCTERWTPAVWRHHKVTRNLRHKIHTSQWCKPRAPLSLWSTSAVCSHSVYTAQLQGKHSTGIHYPSNVVCKTAFNYSLSCVFIIL